VPSPLVSVLITVFNRERYLGAAIESVLAQTCGEFELIIVDDGSTDGSLAVARPYERDARVRVCVNERNLGDYPNRNKAASLARGKYLKYVDADDLIYPHCLDRMVQGMEAFPQAALGIARALPGIVCPAQLSPGDAYRCHFLLKNGLLTPGPLSVILRKSAFDAAGGFDSARHTGDSHCWLKLSRRYPVVLLGSGLDWWRRHAEQEHARSAQPLKAAQRRARELRHTLDALKAPDCPLTEPEIASVRSEVIRLFARWITVEMLKGQFRSARTMVSESGEPLGAFARSLLSPRGRAPGRSSAALSPLSSPGAAPEARKSQAGVAGGSSRSAPVVSVLIPARNAERHLGRAIESVANQTFTDWELIIVDDASADRTAGVAEQYCQDSRIRIVRNSTQAGKWPNHNLCSRQAKGAYLKFLHADDGLYPNCLETMVRLAERHPSAALLQSHEASHYLLPRLQSPREVYQQEYFGSVSLWESPTGLLYRRAAWEGCGGYDPRWPSAPARLHLEMCRQAPALLVAAGLAFYQRGSRQQRHLAPDYSGRSGGDLAWLRDMLEHPECPLSASERAEARRNLRAVRRNLALRSFLARDNTLSWALRRRLAPPHLYGDEYWRAYCSQAALK